VSFRGYLWLLLALTPVYLALAAVVPPADDELYYWCWAKQLQLSYYDHPPMTAYMIRAATAVFGDTLFAIRLPAVVSTLTVLVVIGWLTRPRRLLPLVIFTPLFTFGAVIVTPDTPLLMFWALYVAWLVAAHNRIERPRDDRPWAFGEIPFWLLGGVILGCGILGKYTTGLAVIAGFMSFVVVVPWRKWVVGYALHMAVAFVVTLPILIHNIRHDFVPLMYQWKHSMATPAPGLKPFAEFFGVQILLFGLLPFGVFAWTVVKWKELIAEPRLRVCACLFAFPYAFFLYKASRGPLEGNWALACYIALWPLAAKWYETAREKAVWRRLVPASFAAPVVCVVFLAVHLAWPLSVITPGRDRITRQVGKEEMAKELATAVGTETVFVPSYQWVAMLRFHQIDARQIAGLTRPSHFTQTPERPTDRDRVLVFSEGWLPPEFAAGFDHARIVKKFPLMVRGEEVGVYWLLEYSRSGGAGGHASAAPPPRPLDPEPGVLQR
jgi:4-amino-4-deoxy-L-arabinose transferase-like glycosyltransferase